MKGVLGPLPDGRYDLKPFATDEKRRNVSAYAVFHATHTGPCGPVPPTGKSMSTYDVYFIKFNGDKISHMTKIWHSGLALKAVGWASTTTWQNVTTLSFVHLVTDVIVTRDFPDFTILFRAERATRCGSQPSGTGLKR